MLDSTPIEGSLSYSEGSTPINGWLSFGVFPSIIGGRWLFPIIWWLTELRAPIQAIIMILLIVVLTYSYGSYNGKDYEFRDRYREVLMIVIEVKSVIIEMPPTYLSSMIHILILIQSTLLIQ